MGQRTGFTLVELAVAATVLALLLLGVSSALGREARALSDMASLTTSELRVQEAFGRLESDLQYARGAAPTAWLTADLAVGELGAVEVDTTAGFPDRGTLLLEPGTAFEERIEYERFDPAAAQFLDLLRGGLCEDAFAHVEGEPVRWAGLARPIEDQIAPPPGTWDGVSMELFGPQFFRGDGTGFSFRVPVDPGGGTDFFEAGEVRWGASVGGVTTAQGWSAITYEAVAVVSEAGRRADLNGDGDRSDVFDVGRLRLRSWNASDGAVPATDVALGPPMILSVPCDPAADLDDDGFEDPIFLWDPETGRLRVRVFVLAGSVNERTVVRRRERVFFLRNASGG